MFAVGTGISAHARELGLDLIDQELSLVSFSHGESSLQNIIYNNDQKLGWVAFVTNWTHWQTDPSS